MQKIEMIALLKDSKSIVERLQRRGVMEIYNTQNDELFKMDTNGIISQLERNLSVAKGALEILNKYSNKKESMLASLNGRKAISTQKFAENKEFADKTLSLCYSVLDCSKKITECNNEIAKFNTQIDTLQPWAGLELPQNFKGTKTTRTFMGTFPDALDDDFIEEQIKLENDNLIAEVEVVYSRREQTCVVVTCHKSVADDVYEVIRNMGFVSISSGSNLTPMQEIKKLEDKIKTNLQKIYEFEEKIKIYRDKESSIKFLIDFLAMRKDKYLAINEIEMTQNTVVINGYVPKEYVDGLIAEFEQKYTVAINVSDPEEDEDVPVLLKNGNFSEPVEGITEMYALPNKRDVDPSAVMAFFYYVFFGIMLSDAGYGLLMVIGTTLVLKKFTVEGSLRRSMKMFQYCGISTLFWGALFGSWFGDLPQIIASNFFGKDIGSTALWFEPIDDPIKMLLFSFGLGILHLFLGLGINFKILWCEGKKIDAICEVVPVYLTILGVAPLAAGILSEVSPILQNIGKYLLIIGVISVVLTSGRSSKNIFMRFFGGFYGLYNVATGYLSDILSYSRLLALGLATGSIAGVVNLIATMPESAVLKAIMLIVVGIIGHTANMAINLLGAYVHSDRLQFVELFSKFYEGGGRAFKPLKVNTKYIKFEKENIYE